MSIRNVLKSLSMLLAALHLTAFVGFSQLFSEELGDIVDLLARQTTDHIVADIQFFVGVTVSLRIQTSHLEGMWSLISADLYIQEIVLA